MQLKQVFSKYYGQVDEDTRGTLKEYDDFKRVYNEKDMIALQTMLKKINFNYKKSKEPIKTMWQTTKNLILRRQHKKDVHKYYEGFKTLNNVVQEPNRSDHGSLFVDIICRKNGDDPATLTPDAQLKLIKEGEERMPAMQLIMNANPNKYGSLIESYDRDFLSGEDKYPKNPLDTYSAQGVQ